MATEAQKRAVRKYDAANTKQIHLKLNLKSDADILERLAQAAETAEGMQGYIKRLIREDMRQLLPKHFDNPACGICRDTARADKLLNCSQCPESKR